MITRCRVLPLVLLSCLASVRLFAFADPFTVSASLSSAGGDKSFLTLSIKIPPKHYLYADTFRLDLPAGVEITTQTVPLPTNEFDTFSQTTRGKYTHDVVLTYFLARVPPILSLTVHYQGCSETTCFLPSSKHFEFKAGVATVSNSESSSAATVSSEATETRQLTHHFSIVGTAVGYMPADKFLQFLENSKRGNGDIKNRWMGKPEGSSIPFALLLILLGGLALNLTPCVLPLIPINLAIIGAGARAGSRARGFLLGGAYGAGMALAYGALGVISALTGATFGVLNASPWFNFGIAILFLVLGLAMFDLITIDLSRFRPGSAPNNHTENRVAGYATAFAMGVVAALLAGACVAPVVISVLLFSGDLYASGHITGLLLPFVLGLGMALPWPLAGAGLSFLPRPGKWMVWIKYLFGIFIIAFALYYTYEGFSLVRNRLTGDNARRLNALQEKRVTEEGWLTSLPEALRQGQEQKKMVFIDFWASWCKSCLTMDRTTFEDPRVKKELDSFVRVKVQAEAPGESPTRETLVQFHVMGLPTYVVVKP